MTIIVDERARILCVNRAKETVWELGGADADLLVATPYLISPTYISATKRGTLLVTDWGRNTVYEINPYNIPRRTEKDAYLMKDYVTTDKLVDSGIIESRGYREKLFQIYNKHIKHATKWRVLGSHNGSQWQVVHTPKTALAAAEGVHTEITQPWNYLKVQVASDNPGAAAKVDAYVSQRR